MPLSRRKNSNRQRGFILDGLADVIRRVAYTVDVKSVLIPTLKNGLPVYVYRLASLQGALQKELGTIPAERRYQRMSAFILSLTVQS